VIQFDLAEELIFESELLELLQAPPVPPETDPLYRVDVLVHGETVWASNALRFQTEEEGFAYAKNLYVRWMLAHKFRIVPETVEERQTYVPGSEHPYWRLRDAL
jgi:hypothetical protein